MRDRPDAASLLDQARQTLLQEVLDLLPADRRYPALMVANAMAIAAREIAQGPDAETAERVALRSLFDADGDVTALDRRLVDEIRAGDHDGTAVVHRLLRESVRRRLRIGNPKALANDPDS